MFFRLKEDGKRETLNFKMKKNKEKMANAR